MTSAVSIPIGILHAEIYRDDDAMRLLLHIMLMIAAEEAGLPPGVNRESGVMVRSMTNLSSSIRWDRSFTVRVLDRLRAADAIKTRAVSRGTEIKCLYYSATHEQAKQDSEKKKAPPLPKRTIEERTALFAAACKAVCDADPTRLPEAMRKAFRDYWTEPNPAGRMRFEAQPFFDHARRMDTWRRRSEADGFRARQAQPPPPETKWNPRA